MRNLGMTSIDQSRSLPRAEGGLCPSRNFAQVYVSAIDTSERGTWVKFKLALSLQRMLAFVLEKRLPAIVLIAVKVEDLLAFHTEKTRQDTFSQAGS